MGIASYLYLVPGIAPGNFWPQHPSRCGAESVAALRKRSVMSDVDLVVLNEVAGDLTTTQHWNQVDPNGLSKNPIII